MNPTPSATKAHRRLMWLVYLGVAGILLQHVPGTYTIDDFQDDYEPDAPEAIGLLALSDASLNAELFFESAKRHRISRHAEIVVPAGTLLRVSAETTPFTIDGEVILRPSALEIHASRPLTFIYRRVTVARAKLLRIDPEDPEMRVKAVGQYRVLSALATAHRYERQKAVRRDYQVPDRARVNFTANFRPDHEMTSPQGFTLATGSDPGTLRLTGARWQDGTWQAGQLILSLPFSDPDPLMDQLLQTLLKDPIPLGDAVKLEVEKIHGLTFSDNLLDLYVEGRVRYAKSQTVSDMFHPSFNCHLGIAFELPEQVALEEAEASVALKNIYDLDLNRSHPFFDKMVRNLARSYRDEARVDFSVKASFPEISTLPGRLFIDRFRLRGDAQGYPQLELRLQFLPPTGEPLSR